MNRESNLLSGSSIVQNYKLSSKELPELGMKLYEPTGSWFEENKLSNAIEERYSLVKEPRIEKDSVLSVAKWDSEKRKVVVLKKKGKDWETYGHRDSAENEDYLTPEEALFLLESNSLILMHGNVEVSIEVCYSLLLSPEAGCTLEQYRVFSHLSKLGYKLIRHKKPEFCNGNEAKETVKKVNNMTGVTRKRNSCGVPRKSNQNIKNQRGKQSENSDFVLINDTSSESGSDSGESNDSQDDDDDDVVIIDVVKRSQEQEVIAIEDDDSRDSDLVLLEEPNPNELPLENWSYVHRDKFLKPKNTCDELIYLDEFIVSQMEIDILDDIPNIKGRKCWLFRPDERLIPNGILPYHFKYFIDLNAEKNNYNRSRGGFRGRGFYRGRGWYLQRQVSQMKNYTISLMNMVSNLMGGQGLDALPPPPGLFQGSNNRFQRGNNFHGRTWGRISFNGKGSCYRPSNNNRSHPVIVLDDEESSSSPQMIKYEDDFEDVKPKKIKLEVDTISIGSNSSCKVEPPDTEDITVKKEPNNAKKTELEFKIEPRENNFTDCSNELNTTVCKQETSDNTSLSCKNTCSSSEPMDTGNQDEGSAKNNSIEVPQDNETNLVENPSSSSNLLSSVMETTETLKQTESNSCVAKTNKSFAEKDCEKNFCDKTGCNEDNSPSEHNNGNNDVTQSLVSETLTPTTGVDINSVEALISDETFVAVDLSKTDKSSIIPSNSNDQKDNNLKTCEPDKCYPYDQSDGDITVVAQDIVQDLPVMQNKTVCTTSAANNKIDAKFNKNFQDIECDEVKTQWKEFKETERTCLPQKDNDEGISNENIDKSEADNIDFFKPLIESKHCISVDEVLKRLQIFGEYKSEKDGDVSNEPKVSYDIYLPNSHYFRHLPPDPDFRLIILRLEDHFPDSEQMVNLRKVYNDNKNFIFAIIMRDSIAYYLYDTVNIPIDSKSL